MALHLHAQLYTDEVNVQRVLEGIYQPDKDARRSEIKGWRGD